MAETDIDGLIRTLVGRGGPIASLALTRTRFAGRPLWTSRCELGDLRRITATGGTTDWFDGEGRGWSRDEAILTGIAETLERYAACLAGTGAPIQFGRAADFPERAVRHEEFAGPSPAEWAEFGDGRPVATASSRVGWFPAADLFDGRDVFLPARIVFGAYSGEEFEDQFRGTGSKGLSTHWSDDDAILHGVCELAESDALTITYLNRLPVPEIDLGTVAEPGVRSIRSEVGRGTNTWVRAWDITTDWGIPTVLAAVAGTVGEGPYVTFGCAAAPEPTTAIAKAVNEAVHTNITMDLDLVAKARGWSMRQVREVRGRREHKLLGSNSRYLAHLDWLLDERRTVSVDDMDRIPGHDSGQRLAEATRRSRAAGLSLYACDITPPDIREATGMKVWRTVSPEAHPFALAPIRYLDSVRLREVPVRLGYLSRPPDETAFNQVPHPCP